jgi:alpha/beta superfamily hydrolase
MPEVMFAGPDGRLEGRYHHSKETGAPLALVLHPHPMHGGTMNNRITYSMFQAFQRLGFSVMRFNFRGVGRSQGRYDGGIGEISDAAGALDWMQAVNPNSGPGVRKLVDKLNTQKGVSIDYRVYEGADHVFAHHADRIGQETEEYVRQTMARRQMALAAD